jgi:elongation factor 3
LLPPPGSDIIHYANRKLKVYKGNLSKFVEAVPEAQSYYALEATEQVRAGTKSP